MKIQGFSGFLFFTGYKMATSDVFFVAIIVYHEFIQLCGYFILLIWIQMGVSIQSGLNLFMAKTLCDKKRCTAHEVYTHDTKQKKRLLAYAVQFPELCQQTDDDEQGGLRFEIDKSRISIRLTAPYSEERCQ